MASVADGVVLGLADVRRKLLDLPKKASTNLLRRSLRKGAVIIQDEARNLVAVRYGALRKSIAAETDRVGADRSKLVFRVKVLPHAFKITPKGALRRQKRKKGERRYYRGEIYPRNYAHLVEFGAKPHAQGKGMHPGVRPRPFMRTAFDLRKEEAVDVIVRSIRDELLGGPKGGR